MAEKWVIADTNEAELIDFPTGSIETSVNEVYVAGTINGVAHDNLHVSGSKTFIKYEGSQPSIVSDLTTKSEEYSKSEISNVLTGSQWHGPEEEL